MNLAPSLSASGKRERRNFATKAEAERCKAAEENRLHTYSEKSYGLTDAQKIEAAEVLEMIKPFPGRTLRDAARLATRIWDEEQASIPLSALADEFEQHGASVNLSKTYRQKTAFLLRRLAKSLPGLFVCAVRAVQVDQWLRRERISPVTRNNYRRHVSAAFGYARRQGWCLKNPCEDVSTARTPTMPGSILTPEEAERLLRAAHPRIVAWFALSLFAGLRPTEAARVAWNDVGEKLIRIHATIAKTRRNRLVPVLDPLPQWLALAERRRTGVIGYSGVYFRRAAEAAGLRKKGGRRWSPDILRRTFGSYRWVIVQHEGQLAQEMGNSPDVIVRHYREVAEPRTAERFFRLMPSG